MADNLKKQPKKGILKNSSSFETEERQKEINKEAKWDEMNILATHHPKDKDYGHMKIEEPKTPYSYDTHDSGDEADGIDADLLAEKIKLGGSEGPKALCDSPEEESSEEENESPEERAKRKAFEMKRKHHYNEFAAVKLARKLMERDEDEDEGGDEEKNKISKERIEEVDEEDEEEDDDSCNKGKDTKETKS